MLCGVNIKHSTQIHTNISKCHLITTKGQSVENQRPPLLFLVRAGGMETTLDGSHQDRFCKSLPFFPDEKFSLCKSRLCLVGGGLKDGQYFPWRDVQYFPLKDGQYFPWRARTPPPVPPHPAARWIAPNHIFPQNPPNTQNVSVATMFQWNHIFPKHIPNGRSHENCIKLDKVLNKGGNCCC